MVVLLVGLVWAGTAAAGTTGRCHSVRVDVEMMLPDGSVHPPGTLTLCDSKAYSPVSTLHETFVNGYPVGMLMSARRSGEDETTDGPVVMFHRDDEGRFHLFGYAVPANGETVTYVLSQSNRKRKTSQAPREDALARAVRPGARDTLVLAAAKTH